jgi:hypothetical protein
MRTGPAVCHTVRRLEQKDDSESARLQSPVSGSLAGMGDDDTAACLAVAEDFARAWLAHASAGEVAAIVIERPKIPRDLDALMIQQATLSLGVTQSMTSHVDQ